MKTTILLLCIGVMQAVAQGPRGGHHHAGGENCIAKLDSIVHLTDDQKAKIETIETEYRAKFKAMKESNSHPDRSAMHKLREEQKAKVEAVLTPEQKALLKVAMDERKQNMKKMHEEIKVYRSTNITPTMNRLHESFEGELSEEEKAKIALVRKEIKAMKKGFCKANGDSCVDGAKKREMSADKGKMREHGPHGKGLTKEQREAIHAYASKELKPIIDAHKATLDKTMSDLKPLRDTWKADMKAIHSKYDAGKGPDMEHRKDKRGGKKDRTKDASSHAEREMIKFILKGSKEESDH